MKKEEIAKTFLAVGVMVLAVVLFSSEALPWGFATHTYIDDHVGKQYGVRNADEIYGGVTPDIFNYMFELPYRQDLYFDTHFDFMKLWNARTNGVERSLAFGFVSHNNLWGADFSAHTLCFTCGAPEGYAVAKARALLAIAPFPPELSVPDEAALEIFHELVENGVDILVQRTDTLIGQKISAFALLRSPQFPALMAKAYAGDLSAFSGLSHPEAEVFIISAEDRFRTSMVLYGQILSLDEATAIQLLSEQTADLAEEFLGLYGIQLPLSKEQVVELVIAYTQLAMSLCESDYLQEINETVARVDQEMNAHGIVY